MEIQAVWSQLHQPVRLGHKGQNGKVLIIGGSDLFHAASQWSFRTATRLVDMVFYSSVAENNAILHDAKMFGHDGVIVPRSELALYAQEATAILIGPGMRRDWATPYSPAELAQLRPHQLSELDWENDTTVIVSTLLQAFPQKQWVVDAGALQVVDPQWLPPHAILTPHWSELERLLQRLPDFSQSEFVEFHRVWQQVCAAFVLGDNRPAHLLGFAELFPLDRWQPTLQHWSQQLNGATLLTKGPLDLVWNEEQVVVVDGGNAAMAKGGTGDVLAGLVTGLAATSPAFACAVAASWLNKQAGYELWQQCGMMFNSSDLAERLPITWGQTSSF